MHGLSITIQDPEQEPQRVVRFKTSPLRIGRGRRNDLVLNDELVSEWHAVVCQRAGTISYVDLGSTNGTCIDGSRAAPYVAAKLRTTSAVQLGHLRLMFRPWCETADTGHPSGMTSDEVLLAAFAQAFIELSACAGAHCQAYGLAELPKSPLDRFETAPELLAHLRQRRLGSDPVRELSTALDSLLAHQESALPGMVDSVLVLLRRLCPSNVAKPAGSPEPAASRPNAGFLDLLIPFRLALWWNNYVESYEDACELAPFKQLLASLPETRPYPRPVPGSSSRSEDRAG